MRASTGKANCLSFSVGRVGLSRPFRVSLAQDLKGESTTAQLFLSFPFLSSPFLVGSVDIVCHVYIVGTPPYLVLYPGY